MTTYTIMEKYKTFPTTFINECISLFPDDDNMKELLNKGDIRVGSLLNDDISFTPNLIISSFESCMTNGDITKLPEQLVGLYERAKRQDKIDHLFGWFLEITSE
jgi:hypothetical protein